MYRSELCILAIHGDAEQSAHRATAVSILREIQNQVNNTLSTQNKFITDSQYVFEKVELMEHMDVRARLSSTNDIFNQL